MSAAKVTITAETHRRLLNQRRQADARARAAYEERDRIYRWVTENLNRERQLTARCEYLYGLASRLGASPVQLAGPRVGEQPNR